MTLPFSATTRIVVSADQISAPVADEVVILATREAAYFGLDAVGARIWSLIQQPSALGEIASTLEAEFDVSHDRALADVIALAGDLQARGLIEVVAAPPAA